MFSFLSQLRNSNPWPEQTGAAGTTLCPVAEAVNVSGYVFMCVSTVGSIDWGIVWSHQQFDFSFRQYGTVASTVLSNGRKWKIALRSETVDLCQTL